MSEAALVTQLGSSWEGESLLRASGGACSASFLHPFAGWVILSQAAQPDSVLGFNLVRGQKSRQADRVAETCE